ncbi:MAG: (Fe-S)-binding protein [Candidatus Limiplasma sp.]|nr:(Fe-S)-binding protein [Candidatus Limiplasma sp.]
MYSEKAKKHADACRFCWMCRHLCPVEQVTGREADTPRAKGLLVSMFERGLVMDADAAETMYGCMMCGSCTNDCATGYEPPLYIREARSQAVMADLTPASVQAVLDRLERTGNMYGATECKVDFQDAPETGETLVWLGATARYSVPETANALLSLLRKAGVPFAALREEPSSGSALGDLIGFLEDVRQQAKKVSQAVRTSGAKRMVVLDSYDAALFLHEYKDWGIELPQVLTATSFVNELVKSGKLTVKPAPLSVSYHDGSRLARDLDEHEPARELLAAMGCEIHEMFLNRRLSKCCGSAVAGQFMPEVRKGSAENRWGDMKRTEASTLVAACPQSTEALGSTVPPGYAYQDLFVLLDQRTEP